MASTIHKKRTGKEFKITEEIVLNEEMYEEEDDHTYQHLVSQLQGLPPTMQSLRPELIASYRSQADMQRRAYWEEVNRQFSEAFPDVAQTPQFVNRPPVPRPQSYQEPYQQPLPGPDGDYVSRRASAPRPNISLYPSPSASASSQFAAMSARRASAPHPSLHRTPSSVPGDDQLPTPALSPGSGISESTSSRTTPPGTVHIPHHHGIAASWSPLDAYGRSMSSGVTTPHAPVQQPFFLPDRHLKDFPGIGSSSTLTDDFLDLNHGLPALTGSIAGSTEEFSNEFGFLQPIQTHSRGSSSQQSYTPSYSAGSQSMLQSPHQGTNNPPLQHHQRGHDASTLPLDSYNYSMSHQSVPTPQSLPTTTQPLQPTEGRYYASYIPEPSQVKETLDRSSRIGTPGGGEGGDAWDAWVNQEMWPPTSAGNPSR